MNINTFSLLIVMLIASFSSLQSQSDLIDELEGIAEETHFDYPAFKALKIANLQSTKVAAKGDIYMYVSHRFGSVKDGVSTFFGLDNASTKIQLLYGIAKGWQIGLSRESFRKTYAGSVKVRLANQSPRIPVNLVAYATININSQLDKDRYPSLKTLDRYSYAAQLLVSRRFSKQLSLLIAPSYVRQNLVWETGQEHDQLALGAGGRYKLTKRLSMNIDYIYNFSRVKETLFNNTLSIGIDLETGGHVFQVLFSNAQSTNEPGFITNAAGDWSSGEVFFGFNIVRVF